MKAIYIHTINGKPGNFDGYQVCYANSRGRGNGAAYNSKQIRREQQITIRNRRKDGLPVNPSEYGYVRYVIDDA